MCTQDSRILIKRSTTTGIVPTVPSSNDHTDGTWIATDIYKGELFFNQADGIMFSRDDSGIITIGGVGGGGTLDDSYDFGGAGLGREITADNGAVKISGEDGFIVTGTFGSGADIEWVGGVTGDVTMYFNPAKAAFRAGYADLDEWDDANVGDYSFSVGAGNIASGTTSIAMGGTANATGLLSIAIGASVTASADNSISIGSNAISSGDKSLSIGNGITSKSFAETAIGLFNTDYTPTSTNAWSATDRLFVIGNGINSGSRSDALIIQKNGNTTMPTTTGAFSPPILTTTERNALTPTAGMMVYNSTDNKHQGYDGTSWNNFY